MTDSEIEQTLLQIRELRETEAAARRNAERLEELLEVEQVEFKIRPTHSAWKRRPLTQPI